MKQCKSSLTSGWNVDVESQTVFLLFFDERRQPLAPRQLAVGQPRLVQVRRWLWTDGPVFERHTHSVPFLHRSGRRHETQLTAEQRRVLQAEVDLNAMGRLSRRRRIGDGDEDATKTSVLSFDHPRTHLRRNRSGGERRNVAK